MSNNLTASLTFPEGHSLKSLDFPVGLFINNEYSPASGGETIEVRAPAFDKVIAHVPRGTAEDVDRAVEAAQKAYDTVWGERCPGHKRGKLLMQLADLFEQHVEQLASIEALDNGKAYNIAKAFDVSEAAACLRYYGGWADKEHGKVIEVDNSKMAITKHEPIGVIGQIIPWNFPLLMFAWKLGPALACGNCIVIKVAETTPLSAFYATQLIAKVFPPGVVNVVTGYGNEVGAAISGHMKILKVAFTGSTLVGRTIMQAAAKSNLKPVTLELGGKSPNIIFDDADMEQAVSWSAFGLFFNAGQCCCAGSRIFVQESIYDEFLEKLTAKVKSMKVGQPFAADSFVGPATSKLQFDRITAHIQSGKDEGAKVHVGGNRHGDEGYFIEPTIFTDVTPNMRIAQEEIFGPVLVVQKFKDESDVVAKANDTMYGLAAAIFSRDISRAMRIANSVHAGTVWLNCYNQLNSQVPFGGFKQSGIGRELGSYALHNYTAVKAIHINLSQPNPL
ncbi:aldehyde dehydrogenase [Rhodotorula toruloides]|uniref:Aldehyde dehydrogenase n=1 Tax=Rhodotorula toruloides TaxID=5286 RepID=A0A0K3C8W2_RHOTO|nr:aldehyde dehydrogenase [Rhodotorula toruloides]